MLRLPEMAAVQYDAVPLSGGFDQVTSAYQLAPGALRDCVNWACRPQGGYYRIPGYEAFDGRPAPSDAEFMAVNVTWGYAVTPVIGAVMVFGNINGTICYIDPAGVFVGITKTSFVTGTELIPGDVVQGALVKGTVTGLATLTLRLIAIIKAAAASRYRIDIGAVPGSGKILGVVYHNDIAYAFRNAVDGLSAKLYESSAAGWVQVDLGHTVAFSVLTDMPAEGATITQGGVTAVIRRTVIKSGDVIANDAAGYFVIDTPAGGALSAAACTITGGATATLGGASAAIALAPNGVYNFDIGNFSGYYTNARVYGADGVNDAFEFDGATYVPITVATTSKPRYVKVHASQLFMAIESSLIASELGNPYSNQALAGAFEIGTGGLITGMLIMPGTQDSAALMVFSRNSMWILYGTSGTYKFVNYNIGAGALDATTQKLFDAFALDDRGITTLRQSQSYGNFDAGTLTYNIRPFITDHRNKATCSGLNRENSQYRVFFDDGYGLYVTTNADGQLVGHGVVLFHDVPQCMFDGESSTGDTVQLFGTVDGYVMQNDKGTSFNGAKINSFFNTNINAVKSPRLRKRFRRAVLEVQGNSHVEMRVGYTFDWATEQILPHKFSDAAQSFASLSYWDQMTWDLFFWDGRSTDAVSVELEGTGENLQMAVSTNDDHTAEFTLPSVVFHYSPRRGNR